VALKAPYDRNKQGRPTLNNETLRSSCVFSSSSCSSCLILTRISTFCGREGGRAL
jgi:hypothetical protein